VLNGDCGVEKTEAAPSLAIVRGDFTGYVQMNTIPRSNRQNGRPPYSLATK